MNILFSPALTNKTDSLYISPVGEEVPTSEICRAQSFYFSPDVEYICTLKLGHEGDHAAHIEHKDPLLLARWDNEKEPFPRRMSQEIISVKLTRSQLLFLAACAKAWEAECPYTRKAHITALELQNMFSMSMESEDKPCPRKRQINLGDDNVHDTGKP